MTAQVRRDRAREQQIKQLYERYKAIGLTEDLSEDVGYLLLVLEDVDRQIAALIKQIEEIPAVKYQLAMFDPDSESWHYYRRDFRIVGYDSLAEAESAALDLSVTYTRGSVIVMTIHACFRTEVEYPQPEPIRRTRRVALDLISAGEQSSCEASCEQHDDCDRPCVRQQGHDGRHECKNHAAGERPDHP